MIREKSQGYRWAGRESETSVLLPGASIHYIEDMEDQVVPFPDAEIEIKAAAHKRPDYLSKPFDPHDILLCINSRQETKKVKKTGFL